MLCPVELRALSTCTLTELVGVERFELPTSCSQSRRATRLRYTPIDNHDDNGANASSRLIDRLPQRGAGRMILDRQILRQTKRPADGAPHV
jgi:hypothetical protein